MPQLQNSTVAVTGGLGFIGSHLARRLCTLGAREVRIIDSGALGSEKNLGPRDERTTVHQLNIGFVPPGKLDEALAGVDYVFHLAALKHQHERFDSATELLQSNVVGTEQLYAAANRKGVKKLVFSSSLYAYPRTSESAFSEQDLAEPATVYGASKLCGERLLAAAGAKRELRWNVLRYFFVYGPRQFAGTGYKSVIVKNFERIQNGEPVLVCGDGEQQLDYVFVDDVVDATIAAMESEVSGEVFNVCSGIPYTVNEVLETMISVARCEKKMEQAPADWTAGTCRVGKNEKIGRLLAWKPKTPLAAGLEQTFRWMKE